MMKMINFIVGIFYLVIGLVCLFLALSFEFKIDSLLWGIAIVGLARGLEMIFKFFYWNSPKNKAQCQEKLEIEEIEMYDELKIKIKDKSGRYAYTLGLLVIGISAVVFTVLDDLEIIDATIIILFLCAYGLFQVAAGGIIFKYMSKKY